MTKEKFIEELRKRFIEYMKGDDPVEVRQFLDNEASTIEDFYKGDLEDKYKSGMDEEAFWKSCISSHVYCMSLMF